MTKLVPESTLFHAMWNKPFSGTEADLVAGAVKALGARLPSSWSLKTTAVEVRKDKTWIDAVVRLRGPNGTWSDLVMEAKSRVEPIDVPSVIDKVRRYARGRTVWVVASFLSPRTRERLKQERVSFSDATGNMWIVLEKPALFIETMGADKDPQATTRPLASLKGRAAGRVVRALCDYKPPYGIRELAERSNTSLASVARVVALLEREAIVVRQEKGGVAKCDPDLLIRRWTQDYSLLKSNNARTYLESRDLRVLLGKLKGLQERYAVTGSLAAATRSTVLPSPLAVIYVDEIEKAASSLGLKPVDTGTNVFLVRPFDPVVYERTSQLDSVNYATVSQVAADLLTSPGRGPADGEELLAWMRTNPNEWRA